MAGFPWFVADVATTEQVQLLVTADSDGLRIYLGETDEVYIGIEVYDGALRGTFGPNAEIIMADPGIIVQEAAAPSAEGSD